MKISILLIFAVNSVTAFCPSRSDGVVTKLNGGSSGYATTLEGKTARVEKVEKLLESSEMLIKVRGDALTVKEVQLLRRSLPESTTMSVVKNKLMLKACEGTDYQNALSDGLSGSNMWFFIEEDIGGTVKSINAFTKEAEKTESHPILGGITEGTFYDAAKVTAISKLPSKLELITKVAVLVKAIPTKVARTIKEPGAKLARTIKLVADQKES